MINMATSATSTAAEMTGASSSAGAGSAVNKEMFMQLLIAQVKNQDPLNPTDGVQFLTQLAQFSELEQMAEIRNEISGLRTDIKDVAAENPAETEKTGE